MKIECPPGTHDIMIRYVDSTFTVCCLITGSFLVLTAAAYIMYNYSVKKKTQVR